MLSTINVPLLVTRIQNKPLSKWLSLTHPISYQIYLSSIISNNCADTFKSDCKNVLVNREGVPRKTLHEYETALRILASFGVGHGVGNGFGHMLIIASVTDVVIGTVTGSVLRSFYLELPVKKIWSCIWYLSDTAPPTHQPVHPKRDFRGDFFCGVRTLFGNQAPHPPTFGKSSQIYAFPIRSVDELNVTKNFLIYYRSLVLFIFFLTI